MTYGSPKDTLARPMAWHTPKIMPRRIPIWEFVRASRFLTQCIFRQQEYTLKSKAQTHPQLAYVDFDLSHGAEGPMGRGGSLFRGVAYSNVVKMKPSAGENAMF
jgi:hypothetical protein